ncbi:opacity protein-like surface antigen [Sphingomonas kaistensis]|uniref:Opacity protein-like surface antigen n=1 Tax=Sphingomonas kaistensis TaxID=298708 RepID=A0A7X6BGE8_9SPHN|nr:outer membrane beta-barrel protein [Sphingomonas kaistensis]NJC06384.1 opacity protein-like surface antigen [Sphingomonas kaistensis]
MKKFWALLPVAMVASTPAFAQSGPAFTARAEIRAGYDESRTKLELSTTTVGNVTQIVLAPATGAQTRRFSANDISTGFEAGVDGRLGESAVIGVYIGADTSNIEECRSRVFAPTAADSACSKLGTSYGAGLRAGVATGDGGMIYVKGGYTKGKARTSYQNRPLTGQTAGNVVFNVNENLDGYHVGAGFELNLGKAVYTKLEYVRTVFDGGYKSVIIEPNNIDVRRNQILFGLGIRFGAM